MWSVIGIVVFSTFALSAEGCNVYAFERCLTEFTDKYPEASNSFSPSYSEEQLVGVCRDFNIAATCVKPTISGCGQDVKVLWQVLDNVMVYMCSDRTKLILRNHSACVEGPDLQRDVSRCNATMQATTNKIKRYGGTPSELCSAMKAFASCTVNSADRHCGSDVASWYGGLVDAALDPTKGLIDCYFTAEFPETSVDPVAVTTVVGAYTTGEDKRELLWTGGIKSSMEENIKGINVALDELEEIRDGASAAKYSVTAMFLALAAHYLFGKW